LQGRLFSYETSFADDDSSELRTNGDGALSWIDELYQSRDALATEDYSFFLERLAPGFHWRLLPDILKNALYLDIESTGLSRHHHYVTVIGALYQSRFCQWVWSEPLDELNEILQDASAIITFNGSRFDLPFLKDQLPLLTTDKPHLDLLYSARSAGLIGGQKEVEQSLCLKRPDDVSGLDGSDAVAAWCAALYGDDAAFSRLLKYNRLDVEMMPRIAAAIAQILAANMPTQARPGNLQLPSVLAKRSPLGPSELRNAWESRRPEYRELRPSLVDAIGRDPLVVGIDLRGNPSRPTGWAICDGTKVETVVLYNDDEIVERTLAAKPDLVSIDAPLSLPRGRESVSDSSPCRAKGGIVRDAERVLWSRGIRVYPALIRQMQGLTARGIQLMRRLESQGIHVIESYPGAAQDVLNIPRKKIDESLLERGLRQFGYEFAGAITHDELDAITSALVGQFYLAGCYEALGAPDEGYMILPRQHSMSWFSETEFHKAGDRLRI
jgi:uncharacterized protein YprB with RNaseH-like and TPR domain/predicted nuclease with RNAse H fold